MAEQCASKITDVLIIGGGYAGLSAASTLYRATHSVIVFNSGVFRDSRAPTTRLLPGWEGQGSNEFRKKTRADLLKTGLCSFVETVVDRVEKAKDDLWKVIDEEGKIWLGHGVILATGSQDVFPDISGYADCWATGIFPCLFQFGYEERGSQTAGILVVDKLAAHTQQTLKLAGDANKFATNIVLYTNGNKDTTSELEKLLEGSTKYQIDARPVKKLVKGPNRADVVMEFVDGEYKTENFLVHQPFTKLGGSFFEQLSLELTPFGDIKTAHPFPATNAPRVYAAGDCASPFKNATMAIASGICAGNGIAREIPAPNALIRSAV